MPDTRPEASAPEREPDPSISPATFGAGYKTASLIGSIRAGSEAAAAQLCASYWAAMDLAARRQIGGERREWVRAPMDSERDSLVNEVLDRACRAIREGNLEYQGPRKLSGWLLRTLHNLVEDRRSYWARRPAQPLKLDASSTTVGSPGIRAPGPGPLSALIAKESYERLWQALERLTHEQRLLVELRFFHGLGWAEVGIQLGQEAGEELAEDTVRMRFATIRRLLGALLDSVLPPRPE